MESNVGDWNDLWPVSRSSHGALKGIEKMNLLED